MSEDIRIPLKTDHDFLVALITQFNTTANNIENRISDDQRMTREVKELLEQQYELLSGRIATLEENFKQLDPKAIAQLQKDNEATKLWIHDFNRAKHVAWLIASTGFLLIGYYIPYFINAVINIWSKFR